MSPLESAALINVINAAFELWRVHAGKPEGWKPTTQDYDDLIAEVDAATPEAEKKAAAARLGVPWPPAQ